MHADLLMGVTVEWPAWAVQRVGVVVGVYVHKHEVVGLLVAERDGDRTKLATVGAGDVNVLGRTPAWTRVEAALKGPPP